MYSNLSRPTIQICLYTYGECSNGFMCIECMTENSLLLPISVSDYHKADAFVVVVIVISAARNDLSSFCEFDLFGRVFSNQYLLFVFFPLFFFPKSTVKIINNNFSKLFGTEKLIFIFH